MNFPTDFNSYELGPIIGKGQVSTVYLSTCKVNKMKLAIKVIDLEESNSTIATFQKAIAFWSKSSHPNIPVYYGSFMNGPKLYILEELLSFGSIQNIMKLSFTSGFSDETLIATILYGVVSALKYYHEHHEIHRDISTSNILISSTGEVKLGDKGIATSLIQNGHLRNDANSMLGDATSMSPEILKNENGYTEKSDVWTLGLATIQLATGQRPYSDQKTFRKHC